MVRNWSPLTLNQWRGVQASVPLPTRGARWIKLQGGSPSFLRLLYLSTRRSSAGIGGHAQSFADNSPVHSCASAPPLGPMRIVDPPARGSHEEWRFTVASGCSDKGHSAPWNHGTACEATGGEGEHGLGTADRARRDQGLDIECFNKALPHEVLDAYVQAVPLKWKPTEGPP
jgi:hypothetical protein